MAESHLDESPTESTAWLDVEWVVTSYRVSDTLTPPVAESAPTVQFGADGSVHGTTGCNRYTGRYTLDGDELALAPMATTRMMCSTELMEQEMAFLAALSWIAGAAVVDGELVLTDLDEAPVLVAVEHSPESQ
jgi:heat shock protein HslJ